LETKDAGEEAMERNNSASQNSQRGVEMKEEESSGRIYSRYRACSITVIPLKNMRKCEMSVLL